MNEHMAFAQNKGFKHKYTAFIQYSMKYSIYMQRNWCPY